MDRSSRRLLIPSAISTFAGLGLGQMTNVLQPFWPEAPHWVFAFLFWSAAACTFIPLPVWLVWLTWKNRGSFNRQLRMIVGFGLFFCGCFLGVLGLSIVAAGDRTYGGSASQPTAAHDKAVQPRTENSASPTIDLDDDVDIQVDGLKSNGTGTVIKGRGRAKGNFKNISSTFSDAKFPLVPLAKDEQTLPTVKIKEALEGLTKDLVAFETRREGMRDDEIARNAWEDEFKSTYLPRARTMQSQIILRIGGEEPVIAQPDPNDMHATMLTSSIRLGRSSLGHDKPIGIQPATNVINYLRYLAARLPT